MCSLCSLNQQLSDKETLIRSQIIVPVFLDLKDWVNVAKISFLQEVCVPTDKQRGLTIQASFYSC